MKKIILLLFLAFLQYAHAGTVLVTKPMYIGSNIHIHDTTFILADHANCPVIIIGAPFNEQVTNVVINNVVIDGDMQNQDRELYHNSDFGPINNDGILVQNASGVTISNVVIHSCRSGGLVSTCFVRNKFMY